MLIQNAVNGQTTFRVWSWLMPVAYAMVLAGAVMVILETTRKPTPGEPSPAP